MSHGCVYGRRTDVPFLRNLPAANALMFPILGTSSGCDTGRVPHSLQQPRLQVGLECGRRVIAPTPVCSQTRITNSETTQVLLVECQKRLRRIRLAARCGGHGCGGVFRTRMYAVRGPVQP